MISAQTTTSAHRRRRSISLCLRANNSAVVVVVAVFVGRVGVAPEVFVRAFPVKFPSFDHQCCLLSSGLPSRLPSSTFSGRLRRLPSPLPMFCEVRALLLAFGRRKS